MIDNLYLNFLFSTKTCENDQQISLQLAQVKLVFDRMLNARPTFKSQSTVSITKELGFATHVIFI